MAKKRIIPGGRLDKAVKAVKKTAASAAGGAGLGALSSTGVFLDPGMGMAAVKAAEATLPSAGSATLGGMALGAAVPAAVYAGKKIHHALQERQFKKLG
jgi:hypothetical protein